VAVEQNALINIYTKTTEDFSNIICNLDGRMFQMYQENLVRSDYNIDEYILFLDDFLSLFASSNSDLSIIIKPLDNFDVFAKDELSYNNFILSKVRLNLNENKIYSYENKIFIQYSSTIIEGDLIIMIDSTKTYPGEFGLLIYCYMTALEMSYSKYLLIDPATSID
jgi:hypothetical protein